MLHFKSMQRRKALSSSSERTRVSKSVRNSDKIVNKARHLASFVV